MQKIILTLLVALLNLSLCAQETQDPPYKKHPFYPPAKILLTDSMSWFTKADLPKKKPVMLILFNPTCEHCQQETEEMTQQIDRLKKVHIVMATTAPFDQMKDFAEKYKLGSFGNITVGRDIGFFLPVFYDIRNLPFHAFYNKKLELVSVFSGSMTVAKSLVELEK